MPDKFTNIQSFCSLCKKLLLRYFYALNYGQNYFRNRIQLFRTLRNIVHKDNYTQLLKTSSRAIASTVYGFLYCHFSETINDADYTGWPIFSSSELLIPKLLEVFFMKLLKLFHKLWKFFFSISEMVNCWNFQLFDRKTFIANAKT